MRGSEFFSSVALLLLRANAVQSESSEDGAIICDKERIGGYNESLMYYPNGWNEKSPDDGFVCMTVYNSTPAYDATWNWGANIQDVHSYPYVRFGHEDLPMRLSSMRSIRLSTKWIMTPGALSELPRTFSSSVWDDNKETLESNNIEANAAWDFFLDNDRNTTMYPQEAAIEFMVWLGSVGDPWWLGRLNGTILANVTLGDAEFSLYYGRNSGGTHVFTAVPRDGEDILSIDEDFYPLFEFILEQAHKHPDTPDDLPKDPYLGIVEFGSETWFSEGNVTFTAANFGMELDGDVEESSDDDANKNDTSDEDEENHAETLIGLPTFGYTVAIGLMVKALW
ncbi:concanavalin A-like lectin/glucanase domain-containing protein [Dactylonectria estremocensis]|uniref:Concanavalin A-like lectin/glucanase domain-containing protein n=1 Tax=Dactylonectria estremocensis TaxID=1079267 RepID=A0A9P9IP33_9HYPO|nr:concanavalin A-like lectin/glucanase domain-containing protein [Dactylonectria estremocensis]